MPNALKSHIMFLNFNLLLPTTPVFVCWIQNSNLYKSFAKSAFGLFIIFATVFPAQAQSVTNGNFNNTTSGWGCSPEATYVEKTYGGSSSSNRVAEVDQQAGLCQTISGFTVGYQYELTFECSRRTTCGPTLQTLDVTINGGVLSESISRNGGGFSFTTESFTFVASSTSHTLTFDGTVAGTCGLIVDDIALNFVSALPVELTHFTTKLNDIGMVDISWATAMELNNDFFSVERSTDGINWTVLEEIPGAGNASTVINYTTVDLTPVDGVSYYRLKQTDFDGQFTYSNVNTVQITNRRLTITAFPNPTKGQITIKKAKMDQSFKLYNSVGQDVTSHFGTVTAPERFNLDLTNLPTGIYKIKVGDKFTTINKI
jgi:hypothetical protein